MSTSKENKPPAKESNKKTAKRKGTPLFSLIDKQARHEDEKPFEIAEPVDKWNVETVAKALPMIPQMQINDLWDVLTHVEQRIPLKRFISDWERYRFQDSQSIWNVIDDKAKVEAKKEYKSKRSSVLEILRSVLTFDYIRVNSKSTSVSLEASRRLMDYMLLFDLKKNDLERKALAHHHKNMTPIWDSAVDLLKANASMPSSTLAQPSPVSVAAPSNEPAPTTALISSPPQQTAGGGKVAALPGSVSERDLESAAQQRMMESTRFVPCAADILWDDIMLDPEIKASIEEAILGLEPECNLDLVTGILLYGVPGTGKTVLVQAIANDVGVPMFQASKDMIMSKYQGDSEKNLRALFAHAEKNAPSIIFFDEVDTFTQENSTDNTSGMPDLRNLLQSLWSQIANRGIPVMVIGTTNHPDRITSSCMRRFNLRLHIRLPTPKMRADLLFRALQRRAHQLDEFQCLQLAESTGMLSGDDIIQAVKRAGRAGFREVMKANHFVEIDDKLYACNAEYEGAFTAKYRSLSNEQRVRCHTMPLHYMLTYEAVESCLKEQTVVYKQSDVDFLDAWTREHGS